MNAMHGPVIVEAAGQLGQRQLYAVADRRLHPAPRWRLPAPQLATLLAADRDRRSHKPVALTAVMYCCPVRNLAVNAAPELDVLSGRCRPMLSLPSLRARL